MSNTQKDEESSEDEPIVTFNSAENMKQLVTIDSDEKTTQQQPFTIYKSVSPDAKMHPNIDAAMKQVVSA